MAREKITIYPGPETAGKIRRKVAEQAADLAKGKRKEAPSLSSAALDLIDAAPEPEPKGPRK